MTDSEMTNNEMANNDKYAYKKSVPINKITGDDFRDYRLIALDLDETVLTSDRRITARTVNAVKAACEAGIKVVLSSGRAYNSMDRFYSELGLDTPLIAYQGAIIYSPFGKSYMKVRDMDGHVLDSLIKYGEENGLQPMFFVDEQVYTDRETVWSQEYNNISGLPIKYSADGSLLSIPHDRITKLIFVNAHDKLEKHVENIKKLAGADKNVMFSLSVILEVTASEANKGSAVEYIAGHYGIERRQVVAMGDSFNDISMIKYAGLGVCVDNSRDAIKDEADYITASNNDDGVAALIERITARIVEKRNEQHTV